MHRSTYASNATDWTAWFATADELQFAAELLKPQVTEWWRGVVAWTECVARPRTVSFPALGCHSIFLMLFAFAIENLCKGALIRDRRVDASSWSLPDARLPKELKTHDLRFLARAADFAVDELEEDMLARLTRAGLWRGRYPVAVRYDESIHTVSMTDGRKFNARRFGESDVARVELLVARLRDHLGATRSFTVARDAAP